MASEGSRFVLGIEFEMMSPILSEDAERMGDIISNSMPRTNLEPSEAKVHPDDVLESGLRLAGIILDDPSGDKRPDVGLLVDAAHCISSDEIAQSLREKVDSMQDTQVIEWIQELEFKGSETDQS